MGIRLKAPRILEQAMRSIITVVFLIGPFISAGNAQPAVVVPGDNLVSQGIPPIPAELAQAIDRYTHFRAATLDDWHPIERRMLINTRFGDTSQVHVVKMPGGARSQVTFFPDTASGASYQPKNGEYF